MPASESDTFELIIARSEKYAPSYSGTCFDTVAKSIVDAEISEKVEIQALLQSIATIMKKQTKIVNSKLPFPVFKKGITEHIAGVTTSLANMDEPKQQEIKTTIEQVNNKLVTCEKFYTEMTAIKEELSKLIPNFIVFDSFDDILPEFVTQEQVKTSRIMNRFCKVAKLDADKLFAESNGQARKQTSDKISAQISGDFSTYYKQDVVKLKISLDGPKLHFFIYDSDELTPFKPEQRSKGLQWFISFFLTLNAESNDNSIILIDEPGLFLHAKAQEDVLNVLETIATKQQVIFTTHSPYLIDANRLERIRLAIKDKYNHTKVENKIHKGADKDTMTPIITAIGLDITKGLTFSPTGNILLEGMSDYYYLQAMRTYLGGECAINSDVHFIPNVGADQIPNMAALLFGWGIEFKVLLDNDAKGSSVAKKLLTDLHLDQDNVILLDTGERHSIEDVFTKIDFFKYVLERAIEEGEESNSKKIKGLDKILLAKQLCSKIHKGEVEFKFEETTIDNFTSLFKKLA